MTGLQAMLVLTGTILAMAVAILGILLLVSASAGRHVEWARAMAASVVLAVGLLATFGGLALMATAGA